MTSEPGQRLLEKIGAKVTAVREWHCLSPPPPLAVEGSDYFHTLDGKNGTALHQAVSDNALEATSYLLEVGAEVDAVEKHRHTPLHIAAACGHPELLEMLLQARADPCARDRDGQTPVDVAKEWHGARALQCFREVGLAAMVAMEGWAQSM